MRVKMPRNYFLINLILLIVIGLIGFRFYKTWVRPLDIPTEVSQQQIQVDKKNVIDKKLTDKKGLGLDEAAYDVIVRKDLFRPSRSAPLVKDTFAISSPNGAPKLFGTVIINNERSAILEDPSTKITKLYRINDSFAGYIVSDIQKDKVILLKGDKSIEVRLRAIKNIRLPRQKPKLTPSKKPRRNLRRPPSSRRSPAPHQVTPPPPYTTTPPH